MQSLRHRIAERLPRSFADLPHEAGRSDYDLSPGLQAARPPAPVLRPAAVLIPIIARPEPTVLLTERAAHLAAHAGQISFPGGRVDPSDGGPIDTALRETEEEVGLPRAFIEPVGVLDLYETGTGFRIHPVVGIVREGFSLALDPSEVASAFEVPFAFLMDPANHQLHSRDWQGRRREFYAMPFGERYIWGATAGIVKALYDRLFG